MVCACFCIFGRTVYLILSWPDAAVVPSTAMTAVAVVATAGVIATVAEEAEEDAEPAKAAGEETGGYTQAKLVGTSLISIVFIYPHSL